MDNNNFEDSIKKAFRTSGYGFPKTIEEIKLFEKNFDCSKPNKIPPRKNPLNILDRRKHQVIINLKQGLKNESTHNMARAAREGKQIPDEIKRQMQKDRKESQENL